MKSNLVRILAIATLATSLSPYASARESKHDDTNASAATQQNDCNGKKGKKQKGAHTEEKQNQEFERVLLGTRG
jgi:hypothetical protein